ncbi:MAG: META domain-containing protein [Devosia sp.]
MLRVVGIAFLLLGLVTPAEAAKVTLAGEVTYRERIALPPGATLALQLIDTTLPDLPPRVDVSAPIGPGQVPLSFSFALDEAIILPGHAYGLAAQILDGNLVLFRTATPLVVSPLADSGPLEVLVSPPAPTTIASSSAEAPLQAPALLGIAWTATLVGEIQIASRNAPSLTIGSDDRAGGSGGCNAWFAEARIAGDTIGFSSIASTKRACSDTRNAAETAYFAALSAAATWTMSGDTLRLFGTDGRTLVEFAR